MYIQYIVTLIEIKRINFHIKKRREDEDTVYIKYREE